MIDVVTEAAGDIWTRTLKPEEGDLPPEAARYFFGVNLSAPDVERVQTLSAKAREGSLTEKEDRELDCYIEVGWFLDLMKSKARISLKGK
jgi:hypothetical protein